MGLDVHAETIAVAVAEAGGAIRSHGTIANRLEAVRKLVKKLAEGGKLKCCYEAGPTGYWDSEDKVATQRHSPVCVDLLYLLRTNSNMSVIVWNPN